MSYFYGKSPYTHLGGLLWSVKMNFILASPTPQISTGRLPPAEFCRKRSTPAERRSPGRRSWGTGALSPTRCAWGSGGLGLVWAFCVQFSWPKAREGSQPCSLGLRGGSQEGGHQRCTPQRKVTQALAGGRGWSQDIKTSTHHRYQWMEVP